MQIGNRAFPYPVLNKNKNLSGYKDCSDFELKFDVDDNGAPFIQDNEVIFKNLCYTISEPSLSNYIKKGQIKGALIVECSSAVYRKKFDISEIPYDLHISTHEVNGNVIVSCYLYATEDIIDFKSSGFIDEYDGYNFDIDKFDILAVDDGYKINIELDPKEDDKVSSIFQVIRKYEDNDVMSCDYDDKKVYIYLPVLYFNDYENIKTKQECNNIAFSILAIPALSWSLWDISTREYDSIEDIIEHHSWFNAICISYEKKTGEKLTFEDFIARDKLELSQLVLNSASCNALKDFDNMLLGGITPNEEEEEDL